jgi:hypothetical protein
LLPRPLWHEIRNDLGDVASDPQKGPPAAITGFFTVRRVPWIMLWTVFSVFIN